MKWLTFEIQREPGFRFNLIDLGLIVAILVVTFVLHRVAPGSHFVWLPPYIGLSFFLFCNVFRIGNRLEVFWYVPFVTLALCLWSHPDVFWAWILAVCEPLKVVLIVVRIARGGYRGIFSKSGPERPSE